MAKKEAPALLGGTAKIVHVPLIVGPILANVPREKVDVVAEFMDFKIATLSDEQLIDGLGLVKTYSKELEKWEKLGVDVLKRRLGEPPAGEAIVKQGTKYEANLSGVGRRTLSKEKLIAKFGEAELEDCYVDSVVPTLKVVPRVPE